MTNTFSSHEKYIKFQEQIYSLYENWNKRLSGQTIVNKKEAIGIGNVYPLLPLQDLHINWRDYYSFLSDLFSALKKYQPELSKSIYKLELLLDYKTINKWFAESVTLNTYYFTQFAEENDLPDWLPLFVAEHVSRPFLQKAAKELNSVISIKGHIESCPVCGEPPRLAVINRNGKKEITCPRCHFSWEQKKISCAYCGTDDHEQLVILKVEGDDLAEVYACKICNGYTKVIKSEELIKEKVIELLDLNTIYLDYLAQGKGFGSEKVKKVH